MEKREAMEKLIFDALARHERMEDKHFYKALRKKMGAKDDLGLLAEQKKLEAQVLAARALPGDRTERIMAIMDTVGAHALMEENEILPQAENFLDNAELEELGMKMEPMSVVAMV